MAEGSDSAVTARPPAVSVRRLGVVVHPARPVEGPMGALREWAAAHDAQIVQIQGAGQGRTVAEPGEAADCDLIVSIGGDGTMLAALRAAVAADRPALGLACGSLGVLTAIEVPDLSRALDRFCAGDWSPRRIPALVVTRDGAQDRYALNDLAVVRAGIGQVRVTVRVDGILFSRLAGDGCIVSTPLGSSAYSLAAGSALLMPETDAYLLTPLPTHGGSRQPLVLAPGARLELEVAAGIGGARLEIDGQIADTELRSLAVRFQPHVATVVGFSDSESLFASLRRRRILVDSPRIVADDDTA